ncbi:MAG: STAS domain-containing protein [Microscillaceae bacterium]|nr:STAS domain-containing protein [Microscillaceae bacterium]
MNFSIQVQAQTLLIAIEGKLLGDGTELLLIDQLKTFIEEDEIRRVAVDLRPLALLNSQGLNLLLRMLAKVRNRGGELVLVRPPENIQKLLLMTKLNAIFTIVDSPEAAIELLENLPV